METIRYSKDASICIVHNSKTGEYSCPTQDDMDTLPVGPDLTDEEIRAQVDYAISKTPQATPAQEE